MYVYIYSMCFTMENNVSNKMCTTTKRLCHEEMRVARRAVWLCHSRCITSFSCARPLCKFGCAQPLRTTSAHNLTD